MWISSHYLAVHELELLPYLLSLLVGTLSQQINDGGFVST